MTSFLSLRERIPEPLLPRFRAQQYTRLLRNLRISLPAGAAVSLFFIPWNRWHGAGAHMPFVELGLLLALGLIALLGLTYLDAVKRRLDKFALFGIYFTLVNASLILSLLPNGFLYGVGALLTLIIVITVLAVDLSLVTIVTTAIGFLTIPNLALYLSDAPGLTFMNTNWVLAPGILLALGLAYSMSQAHRTAFLLEVQLEAEKERSDALLYALLPPSIATRMISQEETIADFEPGATVLFADIVGFTSMSRDLSAAELVDLLTRVFTTLDVLALDHGLEKIKTIGDAYMVAAGVASASDRSAVDVARFACEAIDAAQLFTSKNHQPLRLRVGMASGAVVSGVIGLRKPHYDLWGTTVNFASRLETTAPIGGIHVDEMTARLLQTEFEIEERGQVEIYGFGTVGTCLLLGPKDPVPLDEQAGISVAFHTLNRPSGLPNAQRATSA